MPVRSTVRERIDSGRFVSFELWPPRTPESAAAHIKLSRAGFNRYFPFGGYGSDSGDRTELTNCALARGERLLGEKLDPKQVLVVGDTPKDLDAAHGADCVAVGVATGHYSREQLEEAGADAVLDSLRDPFPGIE